ncbi:MAG: hypothetical protein LBS09_03835 [Bacteroidales bacterium]|jgi:hypothetical protein|nr:hypothetical protein [Bacteroidales bacterium]
MHPEKLTELLHHPEQTETLSDDLEQLTATYPWFHVAHQLLLQCMSRNGNPLLNRQLEKSSLCVHSRDVLYRYLYHTDEWLRETYLAPNTPNNINQNQLIDKFLKTNPKIARCDTDYQADLSAGLQDDQTNFATETLAKIYAEQGHKQKAIKIYQQLILKYPEKHTYFATQIEHLKKT